MSTPIYYVLPDYTSPEDYVQSGIFIDWKNRIIYVPRIYMELVQTVPTVIYQLDTNQFRLDLKDLEDSIEGMAHPDTHRHNTTVTVGGVQLARVIEIINDYTITFEDGKYAVVLTNSNNNIADRTNVNQVSVRSTNSAGLVTITQTNGVGTVVEVANAVWGAVAADNNVALTMGAKMNAAGNSGDPWVADVSNYAPGTAGHELQTIFGYQPTLLDAIGNVSVASSSVNSPATAFNLVVGSVVTGNYTSTHAAGGAEHHILSNGGGIIDVNYDFNIGLNALPTSLWLRAHADNQQQTVTSYAFNYLTNQYEEIGTVAGDKVNEVLTFPLYPQHMGTNGALKIRFYGDSTSTMELHIDQMFVSYSTVAPTAVQIAEEVRTELTPELTHILTLENNPGLTNTQATMLLEMYQLLGLDPTKPLIVTQTSRVAGTIAQSIETDSNQTKVTRV